MDTRRLLEPLREKLPCHPAERRATFRPLVLVFAVNQVCLNFPDEGVALRFPRRVCFLFLVSNVALVCTLHRFAVPALEKMGVQRLEV